MKNDGPIWQIAAGPSNRSYTDVFLNYDIALIGPGWYGRWNEENPEKSGSAVWSFATEPQKGNIIILRRGLRVIEAVGLIVGEYDYFEQFYDVNGWQIQHGRRVRWIKLEKEHKFDSPVFPQRSFSRSYSSEVQEYVQQFVTSLDKQTGLLQKLPDFVPTLEPPILRDVANILDLFNLYKDWETHDVRPTEDEMVSHFLIPLLKVLGWSSECIAIKWNNVDISVFNKGSRLSENLQFIIEAKRPRDDAAIEGALGQAYGYLQDLDVVNKGVKVILTDGERYLMYDGTKERNLIARAHLSYLTTEGVNLFKEMKNPNQDP